MTIVLDRNVHTPKKKYVKNKQYTITLAELEQIGMFANESKSEQKYLQTIKEIKEYFKENETCRSI